MKIAVYTITKNEEQFMQRWADSARDADLLLVADTGSTDETMQAAYDAGIDRIVPITVSPWRFDDARNTALSLIPVDVDICIALDADEILVEGWREHLEGIPLGTTRPRYKYTWSWNDDGSEGLTYGGDKIHARHGYRWKHPVHEVITPSLGFKEVQHWCGLEIHHHPDHTKSRGQYFNLLEWAVKETPNDDRNAYYLGREYYYHQRFDSAASELRRYLDLPSAVWKPERSAAKRLLAKCEPDNAERWLIEASVEAPDRREPWVELGQFYYREKRWQDAYDSMMTALEITEKPLEYLCDAESWGYLPHDVAGISSYYLDDPACVDHGLKALAFHPDDQRLKQNLIFYTEKFPDSIDA
jgi:glycosyltransferase involved in cell wall biosynthesis